MEPSFLPLSPLTTSSTSSTGSISRGRGRGSRVSLHEGFSIPACLFEAPQQKCLPQPQHQPRPPQKKLNVPLRRALLGGEGWARLCPLALA